MNSTTDLHRRGVRHPGPPPRPPADRPRPPRHRHHALAGADELRALGAEPVVVDPLDAEAVREAVVARASRTSSCTSSPRSPALGMTRNFDKSFAVTNRLRTEGTDYLIAAARAAGARRLVCPELRRLAVRAQRRPGQDRGRPARPRAAGRRARDARRDPPPRARGRSSRGLEGVVLRYGGFYGPDDVDRHGRRALRARPQAPLPDRRRRRAACGRSSTSTTRPRRPSRRSRAARRAIYNVVDDDPAPTSEWLPALAEPARRAARRGGVPGWLIRLAGGPQAYSLMTRQRGASNAKAVARPRLAPVAQRGAEVRPCLGRASTAGSPRTSRRARGTRARTRAWRTPRRASGRCSARRAPRSTASGAGSRPASRGPRGPAAAGAR